MLKISQNTARIISPVIRGMAQAGTLPHCEANAAASILHEASKAQTEVCNKSKNTMLSATQVAIRLGVCRTTVLRMRADGQLKGVNLTGSRKSLRFSESEIERFLNVRS